MATVEKSKSVKKYLKDKYAQFKEFLKQRKDNIKYYMSDEEKEKRAKEKEKRVQKKRDEKVKKARYEAKLRRINSEAKPKSRKLMYIPVVAACIIVVLNIFFAFSLFNEETNGEISQKVEDSIMADCAAIIGLAVAVWAAVNITNTIERKELYETEKNLDNVKKEIEKLQGAHQQMQDGYVQELSRVLSESEDEQHLRFSFRIKSLGFPQDINTGSVIELIRLETIYNQVYKLNKSKEFPTQVISHADDAIRDLKNYVSTSDLPPLYRNLALFLHAEFLYYKAYALKEEEAAATFLEAGQWYALCAQEMLGLVLSCGVETIDTKKLEANGSEIAYFLNSVGSCYSEAILRVNAGTKPQQSMALSCCEAAVKISEKYGKPREVYYRNYGCAIERCGRVNKDDSVLPDALVQYKKALAENTSKWSAHHTVLSVYNTLIKGKLGIENKKPGEIRKVPLRTMNLSEKYESISEWLEAERKHLEFSHIMCPSNEGFYAFHLYWYIYRILTEPDKRETLLREADDILDKLNIVLAEKPGNALCRVAKEDYEDVKGIKV